MKEAVLVLDMTRDSIARGARAAALGESVAMLVPEVIGCRLTGKPRPGVTFKRKLRARRSAGVFCFYRALAGAGGWPVSRRHLRWLPEVVRKTLRQEREQPTSR